ncbi:MAG: flagellar hook-length control protein FliK [Pseudomonadota bacterium]
MDLPEMLTQRPLGLNQDSGRRPPQGGDVDDGRFSEAFTSERQDRGAQPAEVERNDTRTEPAIDVEGEAPESNAEDSRNGASTAQDADSDASNDARDTDDSRLTTAAIEASADVPVRPAADQVVRPSTQVTADALRVGRQVAATPDETRPKAAMPVDAEPLPTDDGEAEVKVVEKPRATRTEALTTGTIRAPQTGPAVEEPPAPAPQVKVALPAEEAPNAPQPKVPAQPAVPVVRPAVQAAQAPEAAQSATEISDRATPKTVLQPVDDGAPKTVAAPISKDVVAPERRTEKSTTAAAVRANAGEAPLTGASSPNLTEEGEISLPKVGVPKPALAENAAQRGDGKTTSFVQSTAEGGYQASTLATARTTQPTPVLPTTMPIEMQAATVERQIAPQIVAAAGTRANGGVVEVLLDPPELGRLEITIELNEQHLRATISAERQATGDLLRRHLDLLSQQFAEAGFGQVDLGMSAFSDQQAEGDGDNRAGPDLAMGDRTSEAPSASPGRAPTMLPPGASMDIRL